MPGVGVSVRPVRVDGLLPLLGVHAQADLVPARAGLEGQCIEHPHPARLGGVLGLEDERAVEVGALDRKRSSGGGDPEMAGVVVEQPAEGARPIETRPGPPLDRAFDE